MASSYEHLDDLVKEYLLFRRFQSTLKAFENDLKQEKEKAFRVDKLLDTISSMIATYDLAGLRDLWAHFGQHLFPRVEANAAQMAAIHKLEAALLKLYLVNCVQTRRHDKVREFFEKLSPELYGQSEWKEWFSLPFLPNPELQPSFSQFFTRQWQDTLMLSLFNLFSLLLAALPPPRLAEFHSTMAKLRKTQDENGAMKRTLMQLETLLRRNHDLTLQDVTCPDVIPPQERLGSAVPISLIEVMDDFFTIAQEAPTEESQVKTLKSFLRNFTVGGNSPATPTAGIQAHSLGDKRPSSSSSSSLATLGTSSSSASSRRAQKANGSRSSSKSRLSLSHHAPVKRLSVTSPVTGASKTTRNDDFEPSMAASTFLLLGQEEYSEHSAEISHAKFSSTGYLIASADVDGVVKVWSSSPAPQTMATFITQGGGVSALDWVPNSERHFLYGTTNGVVRLCDKNEKRTIREFLLPQESRISTLACSPNAVYCVIAARESLKLYDLKTLALEHDLISEATPVAAELTSCVFNHNSQMVIAAGVDGKARIFDLRMSECISSWSVSDGCAINHLTLSSDETTIYALSADGQFSSWSTYQSGQRIFEHALGELDPFYEATDVQRSTSSAWGAQFALSGDNKNVLTCSAHGGVIYTLDAAGSKFSKVLGLKGHKTFTTCADWSMATDCGPCITGGSDGHIRVSTLLSQ